MMIFHAGIMVLVTEYFASGLPRSRWNYICDRFPREKDVKDEAERGGRGKKHLPVPVEIWWWEEETRRKNLQHKQHSSEKILARSAWCPWVQFQGLIWRSPTPGKNGDSCRLTVIVLGWELLGESTASMWMSQWLGGSKTSVVYAPEGHSLEGSSEGCPLWFGKLCFKKHTRRGAWVA